MDRSVQNADGNCQLITCEQSAGEVSINCNFCRSIILQKTPLFYCARNSTSHTRHRENLQLVLASVCVVQV